MPRLVRREYHRSAFAGLWYERLGTFLTNQIEVSLDQAGRVSKRGGHAQAVIVPHDRYSVCSYLMGDAFQRVDKTKINRVFIFAPSHHHYIRTCGLSYSTMFKMPNGDLPYDMDVYDDLRRTRKFQMLDIVTEEVNNAFGRHMLDLIEC